MTSHPVPTTLEEAVDQLVATLPEEVIAFARSTKDWGSFAGPYHHSGAQGLRNAWSLWEQDTPLARDLTARGFVHGDDRSSVIMSALWHRLKGLPHDIAAEAEENRLHWARAGVNIDGTPL